MLLQIVGNYDFRKKSFADCSLVPYQRTPRPQILRRKLSQTVTKKKQNLQKVFSLESFPLYGIYYNFQFIIMLIYQIWIMTWIP